MNDQYKEKLRAVVDPFTELMRSVNDKQSAESVFVILHGIAMAALNRANEIERREWEAERIKFEENLRTLESIERRCEMKKNGYIQGGGEKRKKRNRPKLVLVS